MREADASPGDEACYTGDVDEPVENLASVRRLVQESEQTKGGGEGDGVVGDTPAVDAFQEFRRGAFVRQTDQDTRARVDIRVGSAENDGEKDTVDDVWQHGYTREIRSDHERRAVGVCGFVEKVGVVRRNQDTDHEDRKDEEKQDAPESLLDGLGHVLAGIFSLAGRDTDELGSLVRESCLDQDSPEADELRERQVVGENAARVGQVRVKRSRVVPVFESDVALFARAGVDANTKDDKANNGNHLDAGEPELDFAVDRHWHEVQSRNEHEEDADEDANLNVRYPVLDDQPSSRKFECECDCPREPVYPTHCKSKTLINKAAGVGCEGSRYGNEGGHLAHGDHDRIDERSDEGICDECAGGTSCSESSSRTDEL